MYEYVQRPRRTILEVLLDFRHTRVPKEYIFDLFPLMRPREFSIASSIKVRSALSARVSLQACLSHAPNRNIPDRSSCASRSSSTKRSSRARVGVSVRPGSRGSTPRPRNHRVGIHRGLLSLPPTPGILVVCIGPGTGIAPMSCMNPREDS